jgi:hypothetical protein
VVGVSHDTPAFAAHAISHWWTAEGADRYPRSRRLLFVVDKIPKHERDRVGRDLLDYCQGGTLAMVRLVETLEGLARVTS